MRLSKESPGKIVFNTVYLAQTWQHETYMKVGPLEQYLLEFNMCYPSEDHLHNHWTIVSPNKTFAKPRESFIIVYMYAAHGNLLEF